MCCLTTFSSLPLAIIYTLHFVFYLFNHFNCVFTLPLHIHDINSHYCIFFVEYLHEDGRKRLKQVVGLPHVCMSLNLIVVQFLECKWTIFCRKRNPQIINLYRRSKKVVLFYVWQMLWVVGYPPPSWFFLKMELSVCTS